MIGKYGADALRMGLVVGAAIGSDVKFDEQKIRGYKNFANKIWNIARFVQLGERTGELKEELVKEFNEFAKDVTKDMEEYRIHLALEKIYHYLWHRLADEIIEESKNKPEYGTTLYYLLENSLKLLHPFMPFITEEIWSELKKENLLIIEPWPVR
jgi:valyl-tRNA synthetase